MDGIRAICMNCWWYSDVATGICCNTQSVYSLRHMAHDATCELFDLDEESIERENVKNTTDGGKDGRQG